MSQEMDQGGAASAYFGLVVPFDDPSPSFVHGFEAGMIWAAMEAGKATIGGVDDLPLHTDNLGVFRGMASVRGYDVEITPTAYPEWSIVTFTKRNRSRLAVIDGGAS